MKKPYITCYMMTSIDGRIDCEMTTELPGVEEYYPMLNSLNFDATLSGRVTAELEIAEKGKFKVENYITVGRECVSNKAVGEKCYDVIVDTNGTLIWKNADEYDNNVIIITSEKVNTEYLAYLDGQKLSYIATGAEKIDLARAAEILADEFGIKNLGIVGGATINTAFLDADLLDEVIIMIGAGIDGRSSFTPVFNRKEESVGMKRLKLIDVTPYDSGAVVIRYKTK